MVYLSEDPEITGEWECMECGYVEEGNEDQRPLKCPECGAPTSAFEFFSYEGDEKEGEEVEDEDYYEEFDDEFGDFAADDGR
jgi:hypothetical protein